MVNDNKSEEPKEPSAEPEKDPMQDPGSLEGEQKGDDQEAADEAAEVEAATKKSFSHKVLGLTKGVNLYILAFLVIMAIGGFVTFIAINSDNTDDGGLSIEGSELSQEALDELLQTDTNIGDVKETLNVEANAIFNGAVLVKDSLDVAGTINVGGALSLPGITVSGISSFEDVDVTNNLGIGGNASIQGTLTVESNLSISGNASVGGVLSAAQLNVDSIQFSEDLEILRHIDTGGSSPQASRGAAIGGAGTVSVSGTDTAGTATINTSGGANSGSLIKITFAQAFGRTPHVIISPVGSTSANLNYYVTRTSSTFTISTTNSAAGNTTYIFDYWVSE